MKTRDNNAFRHSAKVFAVRPNRIARRPKPMRCPLKSTVERVVLNKFPVIITKLGVALVKRVKGLN